MWGLRVLLLQPSPWISERKRRASQEDGPLCQRASCTHFAWREDALHGSCHQHGHLQGEHGGVYSGLEHEVVTDVVESLKIITRRASIRIAEAAFKYANNGRKRVTAVHKANIMKLSDGLFLRCCREVAERHPEIEYKELIVDNAAMQLVMRPETFDILLLPNLYGDIVSDLAAGLVGGLGIVPGANIGDKHAVFEAVHGSAPDIAGKGIANPTALMLSAVMLLRHIGEVDASTRLQSAIELVYREGKCVTSDVGGTASTTQFTDAVCAVLKG